MTEAEQKDMQRACALVMRNYRHSPNASVYSCEKMYRDASLRRWTDQWVICVNDPVDDGSPWYHFSTVSAGDIPCKQCGRKDPSSSMVNDVCLPCWYSDFPTIHTVCHYCEDTLELKPCLICGVPCCPEHAWSMRSETKMLLDIAGYAVECVSCVCK